ncbi:DExH-box splicing factor binding site-domain-containing protein [Phlebopus sp. FC_14]|nr:DExH-box splicing factor binding site-domain-containing protein [Phlebopus sp. FC_14]
MSMPPAKVSFTVRRPTPVSRPPSSGPESGEQFKVPALPRHLASNNGSATGSPLAGSPRTFSSREDSDEDGLVLRRDDTASSDEDDEAAEDELVTGFDQFGVQRLHEKKKKAPETPFVIPSKSNPDWREAARKRRAASRMHSYTSRTTPSFVPDSARTSTGADGSVGGLGTRDTINSGPQLAGLQVTKGVKVEVEEQNVYVEQNAVTTVSSADDVKMQVEETEDEKALRAILAGDNETSTATSVDIIPPAVSETDAFQQDVEALPDAATVEDYARVPISSFGVAMLRGMGWTEGTVASKSAKGKKNGLIEPYVPQARPALLGIGAKEREPDDDGSGKVKKGQEKRYVPVVKKENKREQTGGSASGSTSRRASRSPDRREGDRRSADRDRSRYDDRDRRRDDNRDYENRKRRTEGRDRDRDQRKDRGDWDRDSRRERERDRNFEDRRKERGYNSERDRTRRRDREDADSGRESRSRRDRDRRD